MPGDALAPTALLPWSVSASRHVLRDRWISVRTDDCVTAHGASVAPFYVLEYAEWVQVVAIGLEDHLVLCVNTGTGRAPLRWSCPAVGSTRQTWTLSPPPGASWPRRPAIPGEWTLVGTQWPNAANQTDRSHIVLAVGVRPTTTPVAEPSEELEVIRVPVADSVALALGGKLPQSMHVAALAVALTSIDRWA